MAKFVIIVACLEFCLHFGMNNGQKSDSQSFGKSGFI